MYIRGPCLVCARSASQHAAVVVVEVRSPYEGSFFELSLCHAAKPLSLCMLVGVQWFNGEASCTNM